MTELKTDRSIWRRDWPWVVAFVPLAIAFTWPLAAHFTTVLAGDDGDNWQTLWGFDWVRRALASGQNPFYTHDLWHPSGVTLVFQTFDFPDALWGGALIPLIGLFPAFNLVMLAAFFVSGWTMYALSRGLGASQPASFFAGCAYTFSTYHFAHSLGHMHIVAMQWVPLFALAWWRCLEGGRWRWAPLGGLFLALASLASWYYLMGSFFVALGTGIAWLIRSRGRGFVPALGRVLVLCAVYLAIIGPLGIAMVRTRAAEPINGEHMASFFSADVQSFLKPNAAQALARWSNAYHSWTGNPAETAPYLGYVLLFLVLMGLILGARRVPAYLLVALIGGVLAMGPWLHVGGRIMPQHVLPYSYVERWFPLLQFMGVPVRFGFAATFGLAAALAPSLDVLAQRLKWWVVAPLAVLAIAEHAPHAFVTHVFPTPKPMLEWAKDKSDFAVLDAVRDMRHLWHATIHKHPILGGYLTRTPARLETQLAADPVAGPLKAWDPPLRRTEINTGAIDFPFSRPIVEGAEMSQFSFELAGELHVTHPGATTFVVKSDDSAMLFVDDRLVVDNRGSHPVREASGVLNLSEGAHRVRVQYQQFGGDAFLQAWWAPPGEAKRLIGGSDVPAGLHGAVMYRRRDMLIPGDQGLAHLRALNVRYVVQDVNDSTYIMETQLGLRPLYTGEGVRIYEVPRQGGPLESERR